VAKQSYYFVSKEKIRKKLRNIQAVCKNKNQAVGKQVG